MTTDRVEIVSVVGARPQFVKLAPIARSLAKLDGVEHRVLHTGQHYDDRMSAVFFEQLNLPTPERNLGVGSARHGAQTAAMLVGIEACLLERAADAVLVYGDTNSTVAATLAAVKLHVPVAHVEAGLRSFDRTMPEEINRLATDHCSDRLYAPTPLAMSHLADENLSTRSVLTGDVMRDAVIDHHAAALDGSNALERHGLDEGGYALVTLHRADNTEPHTLTTLLEAFADLAEDRLPFLFPMHPRTRAALGDAIGRLPRSIRIVDPLSYLDLLRVAAAASIVITDSGGLQKEAAFLRTPCITVRDRTEWMETVDLGVNRLVGRDSDRLRAAFEHFTTTENPFTEAVERGMQTHYGAGDAANRICEDLMRWLSEERGRR